MTEYTWEPVLTMDLRRQFGRICINGTRIPFEGIALSVWAGDTPAEVASDYDVDIRDVYVCCVHWVAAGGLVGKRGDRRRRWLAWTEHTMLVFGGHRKGKVRDPDDYEAVPS